MLVPRSFANRMKIGDPKDPLLKQVLPLRDELIEQPEFGSDPVGDAESRSAPGMLQKYQGRALLIASPACAIHCRYCFRRNYPYDVEPRRLDEWKPALDELASDESISEVILSGGDPLLISNTRLHWFFEELSAIPHLRRIRIHSRLPIVLPDRIDADFLGILTATRLTSIMVVHANHPNEIADDCAVALRNLVRSGITTLNQAVLLRTINDDADCLTELSLRLVNLGVIPYYLHLLDRALGTGHFETDATIGTALVEQLRVRLPGYAVPRLVREVAGAGYKLPIS